MDKVSEEKRPKFNFNLTSLPNFKQTPLLATGDAAYGYNAGAGLSRSKIKNYSKEDIDAIINSGSVEAQKTLSQNYFYKDGFYKRLVIHYATLLKYYGILIPHTGLKVDLSKTNLQNRYHSAMKFVDKMNLPVFLSECAVKAFRDGCYYGLIVSKDQKSFSVLDLPSAYCVTRYKDFSGNDIIEFNLQYFDSIGWPEGKEQALKSYPKYISRAYKRYKDGKLKSMWITIPAEYGICFPVFDGRPFFLNIIPAAIKYDESLGIEQQRALEEIQKLIVQKMPHLNDGRLVFEPDEALEMHQGTVEMLRGQHNTSVITSYADVDVVTARATADHASSTLENMRENIFHEAGTTSQLFSSTGSSTIEYSIKNDLAFVMHLANKFSVFVTNLVNSVFANSSIDFKYEILPISWYNEDKYIENSFKLASSGYSLLMPAVAMGLNQRDLGDLKDLENDVLNLGEKLRPLQSSYTQSPDSENNGAPTKPQEEKQETTLEKEESLDNTGG